MNFRDQLLTCADCGQTYIFTVTEQRQLYESGKSELDPQTGEILAPGKCGSCRIRDPETGRWVGRVKWFSSEKGYGFIVKSDAEEIFFHRSQVINGDLESLQEGASVSFDQVTTDRGAEARQVRLE